MKEMKNYYEVLEIPVTASQEEIYQGYNRAKNAYSQDSLALYSLMSQDECHAMLELIEEAYSILSDVNKRREYNLARNLGEPQDVRGSMPTLQTDLGYKRNGSKGFESINSLAPTSNPQPASPQNNIAKIVANKRFSLDFDTNEEMERKIEQATEFAGEFLKSIREYKNVDIARMADMTKVSKTYIHHIENEIFDKLPAPVYVRGFVYQYAKCLKLNPDLVANSYLYRMKKLTSATGT